MGCCCDLFKLEQAAADWMMPRHCSGSDFSCVLAAAILHKPQKGSAPWLVTCASCQHWPAEQHWHETHPASTQLRKGSGRLLRGAPFQSAARCRWRCPCRGTRLALAAQLPPLALLAKAAGSISAAHQHISRPCLTPRQCPSLAHYLLRFLLTHQCKSDLMIQLLESVVHLPAVRSFQSSPGEPL